jgi:hypothetical protein
MSVAAHPQGNRRWPWRRFSYLGLLLLLGIVLVSAASDPPAKSPSPPPQVQPVEATMPGPSAPASMDEALRLIGEARRAYQGVRDYTCQMIKQERLNGRLQPPHTILLSVRTNPFSVFMHWLAPSGLRGLETCYVAGRNNGMLRAHPRGVAGVFGFFSLAVNDPRAFETTRHPITDVGIGHLIDEFAAGWEQERRWGQTDVQLAEYDFDHRRCVRVVMTHPLGARAGQYQHYRDVVYFDKQTHLPILMEAYDWPRPGEPAEPPEKYLLEKYIYAGLKLNVGLGDEVFNH